MQLLAALLACLVSLFGGDRPAGRTHITFARGDGLAVLVSRTTLGDGLATFHCLSSGSGACHYRLYQQHCVAASPAQPEQRCRRRELQRFDLAVGARRQLQGLPGDFNQCVDAAGDGCV